MKKTQLFLLTLLLTMTGALGASAQSCPDNNHPHKIDLGLPSGTKWSCCNVGAASPTAYGGYYSWGETEEKTLYGVSTHPYYNNGSYTDIGSNICGTEYDAAYVNSNGEYCMPTYEQLKELYQNCDYEVTSVGSVKGMLFSHNGASIFLPLGGLNSGNEIEYRGIDGRYWSGHQNNDNNRCADYLVFGNDNSNPFMSWDYRHYGQNIRPVANTSDPTTKDAYCAVEYANLSNGLTGATVTYYYDDYRWDRDNVVEVYEMNGDNITYVDELTIVFDSSFANYSPTSTEWWFSSLPCKGKVTFEGWENFNTSQVSNMCGMFKDLGNYNDWRNGIYGTYGVENLDLSHFDTSNVTDMSSMFSGVVNVDNLDISSFTINPGTETNNMMGSSSFKRIYLPATAGNLADNAFDRTPTEDDYCELACPPGFSPLNYVANGDCESDDVTSLWGHDYGNSNYENGASTHFVEGAGYNGSRGIKVENNNNSGAGDIWDAQFFVYTPSHQWTTGEKYRFKMKVRADKAAAISSQAHSEPSSFLFYEMLGSFDVTTEWQPIVCEGTIKSAQNNMKAIAFNLNFSKEENNFYFDDISWERVVDSQESFEWKGGTFVMVKPEAYASLSGDLKTLTFHYDFDRSNYSTTFDLNTENNSPEWYEYEYRIKIEQVVFNPSFAYARPTSCKNWFILPSLTSFTGIEYLNTSEVTNMYQMFAGCPLESLEVEHLDTGNVTDMAGMFFGCKNLKSIDVSNFDVSSVSDFTGMFFYSKNLESLDLSNFTINASAITSSMLLNCTALKSLVLSQTTVNIASDACTGVGTTTNPCILYLPDGVMLNDDDVTQGDGYFQWKGGYFKEAPVEAYAVMTSEGSDKTLTFYYDNHKGSRPGEVYELLDEIVSPNDFPGWHDFEECTKVKAVVFHPSFADARPTNCFKWFFGMSGLTSITGMESYLNTSKATNLGSMFLGCSGLTSLDVSHFDTSKVTDFGGMFNGCEKLTSLDVTNFDTSQATTMSAMFSFCKSLTSLDLSHFDPSKVHDTSAMFFNCTSLKSLDISNFIFDSTSTTWLLKNCSQLQTLVVNESVYWLKEDACEDVGTADNPCLLIYPYGVPYGAVQNDGYFTWKGGYFTTKEAYATLSGEDNNKTLTFYFDGRKSSRSNEVGTTVYELNDKNSYPGWYNQNSDITRVVFDSGFDDARPTACTYWFSGLYNIKTIEDIEYLHTDDVIDMFNMFSGCTSLETLDVSHFVTSKVTRMDYMFDGCANLTNLDVSSFDTSLNGGSVAMFRGCRSLETLDMSHFDTSQSRWMNYMFQGCISLTSLDLSSFTFAEDANTIAMLSNCEGLKSLTISATANYIDGEALQCVGTADNPCTLIYPHGVPDGAVQNDGYFTWKGGYFKDVLLGDANGDGMVSVADVMLTVNKVMNKQLTVFIERNADVNNDGKITVADVMAIVKMVLNSGPKSAPRNAWQSMSDAMEVTAKGGELTLHLTGTGTYTASQMTLSLPEDCRLESARMVSSRSNGHSVQTSDLGNGQYRVVVYSATGLPFGNSCTDLVRLSVSGNHHGDVALSDIQVVDYHTNTVLLSDVSGLATGIESISNDTTDDGDWYTTQGQRVSTPTRGIYIRNGQKKVIRN